jgi:hypothetical protein
MNARNLLGWIALGIAGVLLLAWGYPRAYPFGPHDWSVTAAEAEAVALAHFRDLGEPVADPYVVVRLDTDPTLERRLQIVAQERGDATLSGGVLANRVLSWEVTVYPRAARPYEWTYRARIALDGEVFWLRQRMGDEEALGAADPEEARRAADLFLIEQGFDLDRYDDPELRSQELRVRTDMNLRYRERDLELGELYPYGVEVRFAGSRMVGYQSWFEDPGETALENQLQPLQFLTIGRNLVVLLLLPLVAVPFMRRYHAGEIGVRRGLQVGGILLGSSVVLMAMTSVSFSEGSNVGILTRVQMTWLTGIWVIGFLFLPIALTSFLSWSVGESQTRGTWGHKLAAFDALFRGAWDTATVARSSLRGVASGCALAGLLVLAGIGLKELGYWPVASYEFDSWKDSSQWSGIVLFAFTLIFVGYSELFARLFLVSLSVKRLGRMAGFVTATLVGGILCWGPTLSVFSIFGVLAVGVGCVAALVFLFLRYDLLTSGTAAFFTSALLATIPMLLADDRWLEFQGAIPLFVAALPLVLSLRSVMSDREFVYRYDDVPPHVRRITERERQRGELETARRIQSSILPELPEQLNGVRIAHSYLPASEVGGDFYDVMALEDGRLAVAVGDVAGHGVSSGLVMSMAKSALAVQVTFNPEVEAVFRTLNRMVFQSARRRLLTTLCYVLLDIEQRELSYASAGHLFPYRIAAKGGAVDALESVSYPLGVRDQLQVNVRAARLEAGDQLFLFSDGVVEARREGSDELFGFERLERSLRRHSADGVTGIRDGVLEDLAEFTGPGPREDDLTVLVLQVP